MKVAHFVSTGSWAVIEQIPRETTRMSRSRSQGGDLQRYGRSLQQARVTGFVKAIASRGFGRMYMPAPMMSKRLALMPGIRALNSTISAFMSLSPSGSRAAKITSGTAPTSLPPVSTKPYGFSLAIPTKTAPVCLILSRVEFGLRE